MIEQRAVDLPSPADCREAAVRIEGQVHRTPVLTSTSLDAELGGELFFKCENLQRTGSFKIRGAVNAVAQLSPAVAVVATHSSGNHGAALARAAKDAGKRAIIVMPATAVASKVRAVRAYGGEVVHCGPLMIDREATLARVAAESHAEVVPPYDDARVIAGQSTVVAELLEQVSDLDAVFVPVGGGGLAGGSVLALTGSTTRLVLAEPNLADDAHRGLQLGRRQPPLPPKTVADGLRAGLGERNFALLQAASPAVVTVPEDAILSAQKLLAERLKLVVEPSGAVSFAAVRRSCDSAGLKGARVGVVLSGGNVDG